MRRMKLIYPKKFKLPKDLIINRTCTDLEWNQWVYLSEMTVPLKYTGKITIKFLKGNQEVHYYKDGIRLLK